MIRPDPADEDGIHNLVVVATERYAIGYTNPRAFWGSTVDPTEIRLPGRVQLEHANHTRNGLEGPSVHWRRGNRETKIRGRKW